MARRIVIVQGHPDPAGGHLCHGLADAYERAAVGAGRSVRRIEVAQLDLPLLRTQADFESGSPPEPVAAVQEDIRWAEHVVLLYPLWLGTMPALVKGFLEQTFRPGFAFEYGSGRWPRKCLEGRSARPVITMGMPALVYRWYYRAHSVKSLERNVLGFCGIEPRKPLLLGMVEAAGERRRARWLRRMEAFGARGA